MNKIVVLHSGGLDSSVLLYQLVKEGNDCYPLSIIYGQRHKLEVVFAESISKSLGILERHKVLDLSNIQCLLPSSLTGSSEIPNGHYEDESMKSTVVPNRNMILLSIAAGYAQGIKADSVAYAAHAGDHAIYPDCRPAFISSIRDTIKLGTGWILDEGIELITPYVNFGKDRVVKLGKKYGVPFESTWSCYKGGRYHCGVCGTCVERKEAFKLAQVTDPTIYEE